MRCQNLTLSNLPFQPKFRKLQTSLETKECNFDSNCLYGKCKNNRCTVADLSCPTAVDGNIHTRNLYVYNFPHGFCSHTLLLFLIYNSSYLFHMHLLKLKVQCVLGMVLVYTLIHQAVCLHHALLLMYGALQHVLARLGLEESIALLQN